MRVSSRPRVGDSIDDLVAGGEPDAGLAHAADPVGGAGGDDVARLQRHQLREVGEQRRHAEDQVRGRGPLHLLAVEGEADLDRVVRPGLVGGDQRRPAGGGAVEDLAGHPLRGGELEVAGGEVVEQRVAGEVVERVGLGDFLGALADDEGDLGLVVDLAAVGGQRDRGSGRGQRVAVLAEDRRAGGHLHAALGRVLAVVEADADDLVRVGDRGEEGDGRARVRRRPAVPEPRPQVLDPAGGEQLPQPAPVRLAQQRPGVDDPVALEHPGPRSVAGVVADQPHGGQPRRCAPARRACQRLCSRRPTAPIISSASSSRSSGFSAPTTQWRE